MAVVGAILSKNTDGDLASATKLVVYDLASAKKFVLIKLFNCERPFLFLTNGLVSGGTACQRRNRMSCKLSY